MLNRQRAYLLNHVKGCVVIKSQIVEKHSGTDATMTQEQRDNQLYYFPVQSYVVDKSK